MNELLFYSLSLLLIGFALQVVLGTQPVRSALALMGAFLVSALFWLDLGAEFLALALIFVYVGAVMVLFMFIVFMINAEVKNTLPLYIRIMGLMLLAFIMAYMGYRYHGEHYPLQLVSTLPNTNVIGMVLYTEYIIVFEILGCLLLSAMVAVVSLIDEKRTSVKRQCVRQQINRDAKDIRWMR